MVMKLPKAVLDRFRACGRAGGRARAARMSAGARRAVATTAAIRRWTSARFGAASFGALGLPGGEIVDAGLDALASGVSSVESLVVSLAAPRLRREGVPLPDHVIPDAELEPMANAADSARNLVRKMVWAADEKGGKDDRTVVLVRFSR